MQEYHYQWLCANTHRTKEWLQDKLSDGFEIHHIDGDRTNNHHLNLILVDQADHMKVHGIARRLVTRRKGEPKAVDGAEAYDLFTGTQLSWRQIAAALGTNPTLAMEAAEEHAESVGIKYLTR